MTTYQIVFLAIVYAAIQSMAYLEHRRNKNIHVALSYEWYALAHIVNICLVAGGLFFIFFYLGTI